MINIDIGQWPVLKEYMERIGSMDAVKAAMARMQENPKTVASATAGVGAAHTEWLLPGARDTETRVQRPVTWQYSTNPLLPFHNLPRLLSAMAPKLFYTPTSCGAASFIVAHALGLGIPCETVDLKTHKTASGADYYAINPKVRCPPRALLSGVCVAADTPHNCSMPRGTSRASFWMTGPRSTRAPPSCSAWQTWCVGGGGATRCLAPGRSRQVSKLLLEPGVGWTVVQPTPPFSPPDTPFCVPHTNRHPICLSQKPEGGMAPEPKSTGRYLVQQGLNWVASELHAASGPLFNPSLSAEVKAFCLDRLKAKYKTLNDLLLKDKPFLTGDKFTVADSYAYIVTTWTGYLGINLDDYPVVKAYQERCKALPFVASAHTLMATSPATTN